MKRYDIHWVRLDPVEGRGIGKSRPCVIVSRDALNESLSTVVVCPLTTTLRPRWRTRLQVNCGGRRADVCADQIRTVAKSRLADRLGALGKTEAAALRTLLAEMYGEA
jgi:mRNA interferase MazF